MEKRKNNDCQCEHCLEIIRQQNRLEAWQTKQCALINIGNHPHQGAYQDDQVKDSHDLLTTLS